MNRICRLALAAGLLGPASHTLLGQQLSISGTVQDATGVIPAAEVTLRDSVGKTLKTMTDAVGQYHFDGLAAGAYEIGVSRQGFAPATRALTLNAETKAVDVTLQVSGGANSIDVKDVVGRATASGMDIPNLEIPSYVVSVPESVIREQGINDLGRALENVSGVITQVQYGVYEWYTVSGITQQSGNDFLYVDGLTLTGNRPSTQLNNVEEVQVFKGPAAILFGGAGAGQGGVINIVRKKPSALRSREIQYRVGRWGLQQVAGSSTGSLFNKERLLYRLDASFAHTGGWRHAGSNRFTVAPEMTWLIAPKMRVTTIQTITRDRFTLDAGIPGALLSRQGFPFDRKLNPPGDFDLSRDWQNEVDFVYNVTNRLTINNTFFKRRNRDQYSDAETLTYVPATDQVTRQILYFQHNRRPVQDITDVVGDYRLLHMRHHFLVRYDYSDQYNFTNRTGNAPNTSNSLALPLPPVPVAAFIAGTFVDTAPAYKTFPITRVDYSDNRFHRVTLQDQVNPVSWLGINLSMTRPNYDRRTHNDAYDNGTLVSRGVESHLFNNAANNYRFGAAVLSQYAPWLHGLAPYFSFNSTFTPVNSLQNDGTPLDPVLSKSWEVGNRWQGLKDRLSIMMGARRIQDQNRVVTISPGVFEQVGKATTYSMDLDISGDVGRGFRVLANYAFADSLINRFRTDGVPQTNGGKRFPQAPKHISRIWITKAVNVGQETKVNFSLGGRYVRHYFTNSANTAVIPSATTFDGAVNLSRRSYDIAVNFANLLNRERYFVSQINGTQLYPGPPINATLTMRYRF